MGRTVIVVPSFPAQGRGLEGFPVFWSTKAPSEYVALGRTSISIRRRVDRKGTDLHAQESALVFVTTAKCATWEMDANASPLNP